MHTQYLDITFNILLVFESFLFTFSKIEKKNVPEREKLRKQF